MKPVPVRAFALATLALAALIPNASFAQRPDTVAVVTAAVVTDTGAAPERRPPVSPRRAFLSSLIFPGYGQSMLGRKRSGAMMLAFEAMAVVMVRESALGVREARRNAADSVIVAFVDAAGAAAVRYERTAFPSALIKVRKEHLEDWIAVLVANHLAAATDAFVSALLWDLPAEVAIGGGRRATNVGFRLRF